MAHICTRIYPQLRELARPPSNTLSDRSSKPGRVTHSHGVIAMPYCPHTHHSVLAMLIRPRDATQYRRRNVLAMPHSRRNVLATSSRCHTVSSPRHLFIVSTHHNIICCTTLRPLFFTHPPPSKILAYQSCLCRLLPLIMSSVVSSN